MYWDPKLYERYDDHRTRPFIDLINRIDFTGAVRIVDLGCGNGRATLLLSDRCRQAEIIGIDSSAHMLQQAREHDHSHRVTWMEADASAWNPAQNPSGPADIVISNAMFQWIPDHGKLLQSWFGAMKSGTWFAFQVPGNFDAPTHRLLRRAAEESPWAAKLLPRLRHDNPVLEPQQYAELMLACGLDCDCWETTYTHYLDAENQQTDPVLDWIKGTGLRPLLGVLAPPDETTFLTSYAAELRKAYPRTAGGVALNFRRVFAVGRKR